jgi:dimethylargininase
MPQFLAITRGVSPAFADCQLTHLVREPIDAERARIQHAEYERALESLGCEINRIAGAPDLPDCVFVEDAAIVLDEVAILMRPGAESRRGEVLAVAKALIPHRPILSLEAPGTMDGGDVMIVGRAIFVGGSSRTNPAGIEQLQRIAEPLGYDVHPVSVGGCLHLKSAVTALDEATLLINPSWVERDHFRGFAFIEVDEAEPTAANIVRVGPHLLYSAGFPRTLEKLQEHGYDVSVVNVSEIAKAEGAVTCCSLIFKPLTPGD